MRKKKVITTNGKQNTQEDISKYTTVAQLLGDTGINKYGTLDIEEYKDQLNSMSTSDLRIHAEKHGLKYVNSRQLTIKSLVTKFTVYANQFVDKVPNVISEAETTQIEMDAELRKILAKGR